MTLTCPECLYGNVIEYMFTSGDEVNHCPDCDTWFTIDIWEDDQIERAIKELKEEGSYEEED